MRGLRNLRYRTEYISVRLLGGLVCVLPHRCALAVAYGVSCIAYACLRKRRREAQRRIWLVFGETLSSKAVKRIAWISFRNTAFNAAEMLRVSRFGHDEIQWMMPDLDAVVARLRTLIEQAEGRGLILALPHMGNWDLAGSGCFLSGLPIFSVAGKQRNTQMNDLINRLRAGHGMEILERGGGTIRQILTRIRSGQIFAILPDTRSFTPDVLVPFLGGAANLARGMASFAYSANVPVVPVVIRRQGWSRFTIELFDPIWADSAADKTGECIRITREVAGIIDAAIRKTPEQWFWYNKRWVLDPVSPKISVPVAHDVQPTTL